MSEPLLQIRDLDVRYGDAQALWDVAMEVHEGETVCVVGPNGAGKSTLVNAVAGIHPAHRGRITVGGVDVTRVRGHRVCGHGVAIVPEGRRIFPRMTVLDNLVLGAYRKGARGTHRATLAAVYEIFPRLAERAGQLAGSLSGGEQQMVAIGRALMAQPRLLLLDEPSLGLAPVRVDEVYDAIARINERGVSVVVVEQDVQRALDISVRAYLLGEGRVVLSGSADELRDSAEVRRSVLGL
ncbi:ABC transporter ATP-binding protein [Planotetraspora kaengkrachanensis]|uniref:ABC transporter ATP-binding protein n=1 Tax=Planotetraspora kaengkrachanensis TaxID=575193 RepID=A0A8J3LTT2_9ACTN|nr:ABC transporter ATP-binding protein [Planotetraspora kaengkrachanensis]GIG78642.1 ABC transporter ATP-binding protein [Planotetraspora kaengkrachanensis]